MPPHLFGPRSDPGLVIAFSCHISLGSFNLEDFFNLSLSSLNLTFFKRKVLLLYRMMSVCICLVLPGSLVGFR